MTSEREVAMATRSGTHSRRTATTIAATALALSGGLGASAAAPAPIWGTTTSRVTVSSSEVGAEPQTLSGLDISAHGRYVVFSSTARNLIDGQTTNGFNVFIRDRLTGTTRR